MKNFENKEKIMKVSRQLCGIARVGLFFWGTGFVIFFVQAIVALTHFGNATAIYLPSGGIVEMGLAIFVTLNFLWFFNRLKGGDLFDAKTVSYLEAAGRWWMGYWFADFIFSIAGNNWFGTKMTFSFGQLFTSLIVIFVAWLLKEAQELQEEQSLTV
jgi:hypothetical protein